MKQALYLADMHNQTEEIYIGKVRNLYFFISLIVAKVSNRISAYNNIFDFLVEDKGDILNQISAFFFEMTADIIPNCLVATPTSSISIWEKLQRIDIEFVFRAYLTGSFYRDYYSKGIEDPWGLNLPKGMKKHQKLEKVVFTPTLKSKDDEPISEADIVALGYLTQAELDYLKEIGFKLFERGETFASSKNLTFVDTKYEFGKTKNGDFKLIDEANTPDSSRYWMIEDGKILLTDSGNPSQFSKEFFRQMLLEKGWDPRKTAEEQSSITFTELEIQSIRNRYIEIFELLLDKKYVSNKVSEAKEVELVTQAMQQCAA